MHRPGSRTPALRATQAPPPPCRPLCLAASTLSHRSAACRAQPRSPTPEQARRGLSSTSSALKRDPSSWSGASRFLLASERRSGSWPPHQPCKQPQGFLGCSRRRRSLKQALADRIQGLRSRRPCKPRPSPRAPGRAPPPPQSRRRHLRRSRRCRRCCRRSFWSWRPRPASSPATRCGQPRGARAWRW